VPLVMTLTVSVIWGIASAARRAGVSAELAKLAEIIAKWRA